MEWGEKLCFLVEEERGGDVNHRVWTQEGDLPWSPLQSMGLQRVGRISATKQQWQRTYSTHNLNCKAVLLLFV